MYLLKDVDYLTEESFYFSRSQIEVDVIIWKS